MPSTARVRLAVTALLVLMLVQEGGASSAPVLGGGVPPARALRSMPPGIGGMGGSGDGGQQAAPSTENSTPQEVIVPGEFGTFKEAVDKHDPVGNIGDIVVQQGQHRWENFLEMGQTVNIRGTSNAVLQGTLWFKKGSAGGAGILQTLEMTKESGSCIIFEGGQWSIEACRLLCSRWAVLWCRCESEVMVKNCFLGGLEEGPGYCVNCQDQTRTTLDACHMERSGGEFSAAVAVFHSVHLRVQSCNIQSNQHALRAVTAKESTLEFVNNQISGEAWFDDTRPGNLVMQGNIADGAEMPDINTDTPLPGHADDIPIPDA